MKGATVVELEPLTTIPARRPECSRQDADRSAARPSARSRTNGCRRSRASSPRWRSSRRTAPPVLASIDSADAEAPRRRAPQDPRRRAAERGEQSLAEVRNSLAQEQQNPALIAAVRVAQQAVDPTPAQLVEFRAEHRQGLRTHPRPASHRRRAREEHRGAQERARRAQALASSSLLFRHPLPPTRQPSWLARSLLFPMRSAA